MVRILPNIILPILVSLMVFVGGPAVAQQGLVQLDTALSRRGLEGVGRIDMVGPNGTEGFCTGALVSPTQVLTAAHCLFNKSTGEPHSIDSLTFRAGLYDGLDSASRRVRRVVMHPDYKYGPDPSQSSLRADLALLELDRALQIASVQPFDTRGRLFRGDIVQVVSYARGRENAPSSEDDCVVLDRDDRVLVLSCSVDFGASGAPVFVQTDQGLRIVSVISAMTTWENRPVALAVTVEEGLRRLQREFAASPRTTPVRKVVRVGQGERTGTIRFLRPDG